ncbi:hypothetical protein TVAG_358180 [Trichomonas vaginalis G3]|uniref:MHD domain-containing protein n=1 Tax=Trichomonas vaginalis (strain ATCC PRA-98 / G3) TaxID=412133 RepID=A2ELC6_TRIV3|nr:vesicle-mediated transport [Trichomonas vaginalis G3]EAY06528.1 hypothetical protein TVAG_358180 [Trichomonas vaginalis G3]KAI5526097.1 vesicle-mediated transport [Trichomonas vaginalis G3]|eukprot:XP_001318751.1 hypothetical protein [Trichomonas vaginalis G3]
MVEAQVENKSEITSTDEKLEKYFQEKILPYINEEGKNVFKISDNTFLVSYTTKTFYICVIPFIPKPEFEKSIIAGSLYFLSYIEAILRSTIRSLLPESPKIEFASLKQMINLILPFGTPVLHDQYLSSQLTGRVEISRFNAGYNKINSTPVPSWKSTLAYPVQQLDFTLKEVIVGSISQNQTYFKAFGSLQISASVSLLPNVTVTFTKPEKMTNIQSHFSVKSYDHGKIEFLPPTGVCQLLAWEIPMSVSEMPLIGTYSYKINGSTLDYSLKLNVKNPIVSVTVHLEFNDCGNLIKQKYPNIIGQVKQSRTETILVYDVQQSNAETDISGTLFFDKDVPKQKFAAYLSFKDHMKSFTGNSISKDDVTFNPSSNISVSSNSSYNSEPRKYVIWGTEM